MDSLSPLPPPFDDVCFAWRVASSGFTVAYMGDIPRLIECGAIEPDMAGNSKSKARPRVDSQGHYYRREKRVAHRPLREQLIVTRLITDPKFAETLPGVPRGLRLKCFDWLDAHPNQVHVVTEKQPDGTRTTMTGTIDRLIAAGVRRSVFERKFTIRGCGLHLSYVRSEYGCDEKDTDPAIIKFDSCYVERLMRGYFQVDLSSKDEAAPAQAPAAQKPRRGGSALRLVIDNTIS